LNFFKENVKRYKDVLIKILEVATTVFFKKPDGGGGGVNKDAYIRLCFYQYIFNIELYLSVILSDPFITP
jgi:hypothetical protein